MEEKGEVNYGRLYQQKKDCVPGPTVAVTRLWENIFPSKEGLDVWCRRRRWRGGAQANTRALAVPTSPCAVRNKQALDLYFCCGFGHTFTDGLRAFRWLIRQLTVPCKLGDSLQSLVSLVSLESLASRRGAGGRHKCLVLVRDSQAACDIWGVE